MDDRWRKGRERERVVTMEVAATSYSSAQNGVVIRVREAGVALVRIGWDKVGKRVLVRSTTPNKSRGWSVRWA